jgi:hypothetical protein
MEIRRGPLSKDYLEGKIFAGEIRPFFFPCRKRRARKKDHFETFCPQR